MSTTNKARKLFSEGCNCAQAVACAYCHEYGMSVEDAMRLAYPFGGGMREKEICGAVTGAAMVIGLKYGDTQAGNMDAKQLTAAKTNDFCTLFRDKHDSIICRDLIDQDICAQLVEDAAVMLEEVLEQ